MAVENDNPMEETNFPSGAQSPLDFNNAPLDISAAFRSHGSADYTRPTGQSSTDPWPTNPFVRHFEVQGTEIQDSHVHEVWKSSHVHQYFKDLKFTGAI